MSEQEAVLSPVSALDMLRQACAEVSIVVRYGKATTDSLDYEHIAKAELLLELVIKAQKGAGQ